MANKLCLPSSLCSLEKDDWSRVGSPILDAVREICGEQNLKSPISSMADCWKNKLVCVVWLKLLCRETGVDVETEWRESPFFPIQNALPEVNHVVLLELVKSLSATKMFARFLLCLPPGQICSELERLTQYVKSSPISDGDVHFFLELWWELWKGRDHQVAGGKDSIEMMFANQFARLTNKTGGMSPQAAKRMKLDTTASSPDTDVLSILLHALKDMKDHISTTELCLLALSISLDALHTSFLIEQAIILSTKDKMHLLSKAVSIREKNSEKLSPKCIQEAQQDLCALYTPSQFQPNQIKLTEAFMIVTELAQFWQNDGLLKVCDSSNPSYTTFRLQQSVQRFLTALKEADVIEALAEVEEVQRNNLRALLESLSFPTIESTPEVNARVVMTIISHRLEDYQNFALLFATEKSWAACDEQWMDCLEKNQAAFQQLDTLIELAVTFESKIHKETFSVGQCRKLMKLITDIFAALSLEDKNKALASMLKMSSRGFFGCTVPSAVTDGFDQELNMAFNCITQGGRGASAAVSQGNLSTAVSLVARVAFQNPEATLRSCCHSAVFNKGSFALMALILQQLPGLTGQRQRKEADESVDGRNDPPGGGSLICRCLQEMIRTRSLSANEKEQFIKFLSLLMMPFMTVEGEGKRLLSPQELVNTFVLSNLSSMSECSLMFFIQSFAMSPTKLPRKLS